MKVLLAVDGSDYTRRMLAYLSAHRDLFAPVHRYTVLHVVPMVSHNASALAGAALTRGYYESEAEGVLANIRAELDRHAIDADVRWEPGHVAQTIARRAEEGGFELIVMGSHGMGSIGNLVLGSVATKVLAQCKVPVLLVR